jgi:hypothetical protein
VFDLINGYLYIREDIASSLDNVSEDDLHASYRKFTAHVETKAAEHGDAKFEHPVDMVTFSLKIPSLTCTKQIED